MKAKRAYRMGARAVAAEETGRRLIAAAVVLFRERPFDEVTLDAVAERAGVTLQTLLRRFGSKAGLIAAAAADTSTQVAAQRGEAPVGDLRGAIANLFDHYEEWADVALRTVAQEERFEEVAQIAKNGRALHAAWCEHVFEPFLARRRGQARERLRVELIATCDVTMWKLLRRDFGLSRDDAQQAVLEIVEALCAPGGV